MNTFSLAFRFAWRELRSGLSGFRIFLAALTLGVAAIAGVGSLGQAFLSGLSEQGETLLGGDVGMERPYRPADEKERAFMAKFGRVAEFASLRSMATNAKNPTARSLIELKAVDDAYPLVGEMKLAPAMTLAAALACDATVCGATVEDALLARLNLTAGDAIRVGERDFIIRARIVSEPDRIAGGFSLGPHVMVSREGLRSAGLVVPGSLIDYSYRIAFTGKSALKDFRAQETAAFPGESWRVSDRTNAIPRVTRSVEQASMFLTLVALSALIVGGIGAGQAVEAFLDRRRDAIGTLKALGTTGGQIFLVYLLQILAVTAVALLLGLGLGAALPYAVGYFFGADIPAPAHYALYPGPLALAAAFGVLAALGFAIPPLARAREIAPAGLFRDLVAPARVRGRLPYRIAAIAAFAAIAALSVALSPYPLFNLAVLVGAVAAFTVLRLAALGLQIAIGRLPRSRSQILRLALANLTRPGAATPGIVVALGLGLTLLSSVVLTQASVNAQVEDQLPSRVPSFIFVNIQQNEIDPLTKLVSGFPTAEDFTATPMLRARIVKIKGVAAEEARVDSSARWALDGDRNVTYSSEPPKNAHVVEGPSWWPPDYRGETLISFDRELAEGMGLKLGDTITINVEGRDLDLKIYNLRDIDYLAGGANFIFILSPGVIDKAPHTFVSNVRVGTGEEDAMFAAVSRAFPDVTVIRVKEALAQLGEMLAALARGVEVASLVTILAGILVLAGAVAAGHRTRLYDAVVLKVLGATRARIAAVYVVEYGSLGALAGMVALAAGMAASWAVARFVLEIPLVFSLEAAVFTVLGGAAGTIALGLAGSFAALSAKPAPVLRNG
jgi:putative ABC transport system permease protein